MKLKQEYMNRILDRIADNLTENIRDDSMSDVRDMVTDRIDIDSLADNVRDEFDAENLAYDLRDDVRGRVDIDELARDVQDEFDTYEMAKDMYDDVVDDIKEELDIEDLTERTHERLERIIDSDNEIVTKLTKQVVDDVAASIVNTDVFKSIVNDVKNEMFVDGEDDEHDDVEITDKDLFI